MKTKCNHEEASKIALELTKSAIESNLIHATKAVNTYEEAVQLTATNVNLFFQVIYDALYDESLDTM